MTLSGGIRNRNTLKLPKLCAIAIAHGLGTEPLAILEGVRVDRVSDLN